MGYQPMWDSEIRPSPSLQGTGPKMAVPGGIPSSPQRPNESQTPGVSLVSRGSKTLEKAGDVLRNLGLWPTAFQIGVFF